MMNHLRQLCWVAILGGMFASCQTDLPLPDVATGQKIVLLGELTAGDSVLIRAGQSTALSASGSGSQLVQNLALSLKDEAGGMTALQSTEDFLSFTLFTLAYSSPLLVQAGKRYELRGTHPELDAVDATVHIPGPFTVKVKAMAFDTYNGDSVLRFDLELNDPAAPNARYVIEALKQPVNIYGYFYFDGNEYSIQNDRTLYDSLKAAHVPVSERYDTSYSGTYVRQQMYTSDAASENLARSSPGRPFRRIFLPGNTFGGNVHQTRIFIPRNAIYGEQGQYAETTILVKSVAADYYDFLKAYEQYEPSMGVGGNITPANLEGNVSGGLGMIGGVFRWNLKLLYQ